MSLSKKAMLVQVSKGVWAGRKQDSQVAAKTDEVHNAKMGSSRVSKPLVRREAIKAVHSKFGAVNKYFKQNTRPWAEGVGLLKNTAYDTFVKRMGELKADCDLAVESFLPLYPELYEEAKNDLGDMFKAEDYPDPESIRHKFYVRLKFMPVPESGDFRVEGLSKEDVKELKKSIEQDTKDQIAETLKETYKEFSYYIQRMVERLDDTKVSKKTKKGTGRFHDSLVENIRDMLDRLPNLNITDDPELTKIGNEIKEKLTKYDVDDLKEDVKLRKKVKVDAEALAKKLEGYF